MQSLKYWPKTYILQKCTGNTKGRNVRMEEQDMHIKLLHLTLGKNQHTKQIFQRRWTVVLVAEKQK